MTKGRKGKAPILILASSISIMVGHCGREKLV